MNEIDSRLEQFLEIEARSCSMDFGCVTPIYVYRMWGYAVSIEDIRERFRELQKRGIPVVVK